MARKKSSKRPTPPAVQTFRMSHYVPVFMWMFFILSISLAIIFFLLYFQNQRPWDLACGLVGAILYLLVAMLFERIRHTKVDISNSGIASQDQKGTTTFLKWAEVKPAVYGFGTKGPDKKRRILFIHLLRNFDLFLSSVFEKLKARMETPRLPLVFSKVFRSLLLEEKGLTFRGLFGNKKYGWEGIQRIEWRTPYFFHRSFWWFPFIAIVLKSGKVLKLRGFNFGSAVQKFLVFNKVFTRYGRPSKIPLATPAEDAKRRRALWFRPFASGALLITFLGLFIGKIAWRMEGSDEWGLFGVLFLALLLPLILLIPFRREHSIPRDMELEKGLALGPTLVLFLVGFFATAYFWRFTGNFALAHAKKAATQAGYNIDFPEKAPKLPDEQNAAFFLRKAVELKTGETLFSKYPKSSSFDLPFLGKKTQYEFLNQFRKDMATGKLSPEQLTAGAKLVSLHLDSLGWVDKAFAVKGSDWGLDYKALSENFDNFPRVSPYLTLSKLLACKAVLQAREGKGPEAVKTLVQILDLADSIEGQKYLISEMFAVAVRKAALDAARWVLPRVDARLVQQELFKSLFHGDEWGPFFAALELEFFPYHDHFEYSGWGKFIKGSKNEYFMPDGPGKSHFLRHAFGFFYWPFIPLDIAAEDRVNIQRLGILKGSFSKRRATWERNEESYKNKGWYLGNQGWSGYNDMDLKVSEEIALSRVFRVAVESRIHLWKTSKWPSSLAELEGGTKEFLDPFTDDQPLHLVRKGDALLVYSVGMNGADEGGTLPGEEGKDDISWFVKLPPGMALKK